LDLVTQSLSRVFTTFLGMSRLRKRFFSVLVDVGLLIIAFLLANFISERSKLLFNNNELYLSFSIVLMGTIVCFVRLGLYRAVVRFIGSHALLAVVSGIIFSGMFLFLANQLFRLHLTVSSMLNYMFIALMLIGGSRLALRALVHARERKFNHQVLIYGAGASGRQLLLALENSVEFRAVAFLDDDPSLHGVMIKDVRVYSPAQINQVMEQYAISRVLLALPSASRSVRADILNRLEPLGIPVLTIPGMADIVDGKMKIDELQDVKIEDLLGRDPVTPIQTLLTANISNKVVMVTGAGGSIGSELCRQILAQAPKVLLMYELSEFALYEIDKELNNKIRAQELDIVLVPVLGSVQDQERLSAVMRSYAVETVYHAAAYKHVPLVEFNVVEGVRNNVFGTWRTAEAAIATGVKNFVLISTDKAVRPTNVMGTTKRLAELVLQSLALRQRETRFCMVRFGNVLGSSGSVVPLFRKQIKAGGPITLTHEDITRYFMTIPEASQLVIQAGAMGKGGDVFVLDMGQPVRIYDLAIKMINLMGLQPKTKLCPDGDIEIKVTGLRPGEKLYEELLIGGTELPTKHPRIKTANEVCLSWVEMAQLLAQLQQACVDYDIPAIRQLMLQAPTGFMPTDGNCDLLWNVQEQARTVLPAAVSCL
jgi:FlaA1/EpsC-like NDP-sugar epimerase